MHTPLTLFRFVSISLLLGLMVPRLSAQSVLVAEYRGKMLPVARMLNAHPFVVEGDNVVASDGAGRALVKGGDYLPVFVTISGRSAEVRGLSDGSEHGFNEELRVHVTFTTPYMLKDVFFVFEIKSVEGVKSLFAYEVGTLEPRIPKKVALSLPLKDSPGEGRFVTHVFTEGHEVLNSDMDPLGREEVLDAMTEKEIAKVQTANPAPYVGPEPEYPESLLATKRSGRAVVTLRIGANGRVYDPVVKEATDPEFGSAALVAVRSWRFLPRVKDGHPVECKINMPFNFAPPPEAQTKE